ncbi:MAG: hypothetical protein AUG08_03175 [Acidobacteria bacterium 13_1_20CM_2_55_15]|nr:MAG: hypothetical protein AUG08_03175 [Acidobacteria bacterium 13_1_20CM_2_55_15]
MVLFHKILANGNAAAVFLKLKGIGVSPAGYATREVPLKMFLRFSLLVVILSPVLNGVAQTITTYAGPPVPVLGALAPTQYFDRTEGIAPDSAGGFYFSSSPENRVYRVAADGVLSLIAGTGTSGFSGDGGPAVSARLSYPGNLVVDGGGNLYIADWGNDRIRKVNTEGIISTIAGNGKERFEGDGGPATSASLNGPRGVAVDPAGNVYIADRGNSRIRKVDTVGLISTIAGNGTSGFSGDGGLATAASFDAWSLAVDVSGNLYITDPRNHRVRKVNAAGIISTVAGDGGDIFGGDGGPATATSVLPVDIFVDPGGNLYLADASYRVRKVNGDGIITTIACNGTSGFTGDGGPATAASCVPYRVARDSAGNLYVADGSSRRIRKVSAAGIITTVAGRGTGQSSGDGGPATLAELIQPLGVAVDPAGNVYIADEGSNRIRKVNTAGIISTIAGNGKQGFDGDGGPATSASLYEPSGVAVDPAGNVYIADAGNLRIRKVDTAGIITTIAGNGKEGFSGDGGPATSAELSFPVGVAVDPAGNVYIADEGSNRIRKVNTAGIISTIAGNDTQGFSGDGGPATSASLNKPREVAVDLAGNVYISDAGNFRIRKVNPAGVISTVAGRGTSGFTGDGGPASSAQLVPRGVAVGVQADLYIADGSLRIRRVDNLGLPRVGSFAQIASGAGWKTTIVLVNLSSIAVSARVNFYGDSGNPLILPLVLADGSGTASSSIDLSMQARGSAVLQSEASTSSVSLGWAEIEASGPLNGYAIFRQRLPGLPDSEATTPLETIASSSMAFFFDNVAGFQTGIAVVNLSASETTVTAVFRDENGLQLGSSQFSIPRSGHSSFFLNSRFPTTANRRGIVEFQNQSGITGVGLRFSPSLSFTSVPVIR